MHICIEIFDILQNYELGVFLCQLIILLILAN